MPSDQGESVTWIFVTGPDSSLELGKFFPVAKAFGTGY